MGMRAFVAALASIVWLAACGGGGGGGTSSPSPTPNRAPSANAGQDYTGSIQPDGAQVGSDLSSDPDGDSAHTTFGPLSPSQRGLTRNWMMKLRRNQNF